MKKLVANNKKAYYDYFIEDKYECGIELVGTEVKSLFNGTCSIKESMVRIINNMKMEIFLIMIQYAKEDFCYIKKKL